MRRVWRKSWIIVTILMAAAVVVMAEAGFWQLRRLHSVRTDNALVHGRLAMPAEPIGKVLGPGVASSTVAYRRVSITGRYDRVSEILLRNRSNDGSPGSHVLTPIRPANGDAVIVDRGWIPLDITADQEEASRPPVLRDVTITGVLFPSERKTAFAPSIPSSGRLTTIPRVDVPRIAKQLEYPVAPLYVRLESQTPAQTTDLPVPPGLPDLSEGPHLSYAFQWFIFATIAAGTYLVVLRREIRRTEVSSTV